MRRLAPVVLPLAIAFTVLIVILGADPFAKASDGLNSVFVRDPGREGVRFVDPDSQEASRGEHPLASLRHLAAVWGDGPGRRVYLIGNSQTYGVVYAPGESPSARPEMGYSDLLFAAYRHDPGLRLYRIGVPNLTFIEALWYVQYLYLHPALRPSGLILQVNFETFRKTGVRDGLLELLDDTEFRTIVEGWGRSRQPYADASTAALARRAELQAGHRDDGVIGRPASAAPAAVGLGDALEKRTRLMLASLPLFGRREDRKESFLRLAYDVRVYVLRITPTTRRSLGGAPLAANESALDAIAELARREGTTLVLFNAPQNPSAPLYRTPQDHERYREIILSTARRFGLALHDFESEIPAAEWGIWLGAPDPIHMGVAGHKRFAQIMAAARVVDEAAIPPGATPRHGF